MKKVKKITPDFPETFELKKDYARNGENFKKGDILERYYGNTFKSLDCEEEAYRKINCDGPFIGFTLAAIEEATTEIVSSKPA